MKLKDGFILKNIAGSYIVVPLRDRIETFSAVINLNETGAFLWKKLESSATKEELVDSLCSEYDVDKEKALLDTEEFISKIKDADLFEVYDG